MALGADAETLTLKVYAGTSFNSFLPANDYGRTRFGALVEVGTPRCCNLVELAVRPIYERAPTLSGTIDELARFHYEPIGFFPVSRDGLRVVEFDGVFVRV